MRVIGRWAVVTPDGEGGTSAALVVRPCIVSFGRIIGSFDLLADAELAARAVNKRIARRERHNVASRKWQRRRAERFRIQVVDARTRHAKSARSKPTIAGDEPAANLATVSVPPPKPRPTYGPATVCRSATFSPPTSPTSSAPATRSAER